MKGRNGKGEKMERKGKDGKEGKGESERSRGGEEVGSPPTVTSKSRLPRRSTVT